MAEFRKDCKRSNFSPLQHVMADRAQALQNHQNLLAELEAKKQKL
jgi:hypothetical protein